MKKHLHLLVLSLVGISFLLAAFMLIATLKPGGIILGLFLIGLTFILYFLYKLLRVLIQLRELLMLSVTRQPGHDNSNKPSDLR